PEPALVAAAAGAASGDEHASAAALQHAERLLEHASGTEAYAGRLCAGLIRLARHRSSEAAGFEGPAGLLLRFPDRLPDDCPELRALVLSARATTAMRAGQPAEAARFFDTALVAATQAGGDFQRRSCLGYLALIEALLGRFGHAADLVTRAARLPEVSLNPPGRRVAVAHLAAAWVRLQRYELQAARAELDRAARALRECPDPLLSAVRRLVAARLEIARDRPGDALGLLGTASGPAERVPWLERRVRLVTAEAHLACGAVDAALVAAEQAGGAGTPASAL
ncbi:hypothetical protein, partial [Nonomuraea lactucae]|uniref:hypothetical protein n=1 Tax=Nonomuraea lactucae TaxID=2249762 RepID=UPI0019635065